MTQEEFTNLVTEKKELEDFLLSCNDSDFQSIGAQVFFQPFGNVERYITSRRITSKIVELVTNELDLINQKIDTL